VDVDKQEEADHEGVKVLDATAKKIRICAKSKRWWNGCPRSHSTAIDIYCDNEGILTHITNGFIKARTKHIDVCYHNT
jgi:hypothetical protein